MVMGDMEMRCQLLVIGGGPGGISAALRAAELGLDVALVDNGPGPGGHCLHSGCLPTKHLLDLAHLLDSAREAASLGIDFAPPALDYTKVRSALMRRIETESLRLSESLKKTGILLLRGSAQFADSRRVRVSGGDISRLRFEKVIIAVGSRPRPLPGATIGGPVLDLSGLWATNELPPCITVVGGGYIGIELATILAALGSRVTLLEKKNRLLARADEDLTAPLAAHLASRLAAIHLDCQVTALSPAEGGVVIHCRQGGQATEIRDHAVLAAIGRLPAGDDLALDNTSVLRDKHGFVVVNDRQQTADPAIFAVGDIIGGDLLAHAAVRQGRVAAEVAAGHDSAFDVRAVPHLIHARPQLAWCGLTETEARQRHIPHQVQRLLRPFSGEIEAAASQGFFAKLLTEPQSGRVLGVGLVGEQLEGYIGEAALAVEVGALAEDLALVLHPFPASGGL